MSSLLTNNSAMVALQTLKTINKDMASVQNEVSTGKRIANARDNAALWGISTTMQTDVTGFKAISESLSLGSATLTVAREGAETVASLLDKLKAKIVAAQEDNVDRGKIEADVIELKKQIENTVDATQFNGLNMLKGAGNINILASLNRDSSGLVTTDTIDVAKYSLETTAGGPRAALAGSTGVLTGNAEAGALLANTGTGNITIVDTAIVAGDVFEVRMGAVTAHYVVTAADVAGTTDDLVAAGITAAINASGASFSASVANEVITITNNSGSTAAYSVAATDGTGGNLNALSSLSVATAALATVALGNIESLIQHAIKAAASFGSAQGRLQTQSEFVSKLMDGLTSGIGALVDADMEAASARLQALQVQQQLGIQALSIANQQPQNILALFRQ
jgi:flagellin